MIRPYRAIRGSVLLEMALIGVMFFALLIGIADAGQFLFVQQAMVARVSAAARWGAVTDPTDSAAIQNMVLYNQPTAPSGASPFLSLTPSMVSVTTVDSGTPNYRLVITVSGYSYHVLSPYIGGVVSGAPITFSVPLGAY